MFRLISLLSNYPPTPDLATSHRPTATDLLGDEQRIGLTLEGHHDRSLETRLDEERGGLYNGPSSLIDLRSVGL